MIRSILIAVLAIGIAGVGYWGYKEHEEKNALLIHAENAYQRSFHELSYHMDMLHDQIGVALAMNSGEKLSPQFVEIWRLTSVALSNVSQLPLSLLPFSKTEEFLSNIGEFMYRTSLRNLNDEPLTEDEIRTLETLYKQAGNIKDELRKVQHYALKNNVRWMDVELVLATQDEQAGNKVIDGFQTVEESMDKFNSELEGMPFLQTVRNEPKLENITGKNKTEEEIREFSKKLFDIKDEIEIDISKSGDGAEIPFYTVFYEDGKRVYMDITEKGGHPITIIVDRPIKEAKLSLNDGYAIAEHYLKQFGYEKLQLLHSQQFDREGVYTFIPIQDDVRIFPDKLTVKVALDNGDIMGLNAKEYLYNHRERKLEKPALSLEEAKSKVNGNFTVLEEHMALITNRIQEEVLVYEFIGTMNDETFRIFINAMDGKEEKVEKLTGTETNFDIT